VDNYVCKWGIVGSGGVVEEFLSSLKYSERQIARGIFSTNATGAKILAQEHQLEFFSSIEELVESSKVDAIYIASPNSQHFQDAKKALAAKKNVLIEKPCCTNSDQVLELLDIARGQEVLVAENLWICHLPGIGELLKQIEEGDLGEIKSVDINVGFDLLGRRLSMSKYQLFMRRIFLKFWPRVILNPLIPHGISALDRNNFFEPIPHLSKSKMQGSLMDFGIYGLSIIQLITSNPILIDVKSRTINEIDVWTTARIKDGHTTLNFSCSLFFPEQNFIRVRGTKGSLTLPNVFEPTKLIKKPLGEPNGIIEFPPVGPRFVSLLNDFEMALKNHVEKNLISRDILATYRLLDSIKKEINCE